MSGEITLRGRVLAVGGIREKAVAALRAGMRRMVLPASNEPDLELLPDEVKKRLEFVPVRTMDDVLQAVLGTRPGLVREAEPSPELYGGAGTPGLHLSQ